MTKRSRLFIHAGFCFLLAGPGQAWTCLNPYIDGILDQTSPLSDDEAMRLRSVNLSQLINSHDSIAVLGRFSKKAETPFFHELQIDKIRALFLHRTSAVQVPIRIEYTYFGLYSFAGQKLVDGQLVPFSVENVDATVSIYEAYEGMVGTLPPTTHDVFGALNKANSAGSRLELTASPCQSYFAIDAAQRADLLECYRQGECRAANR